MIPDAVLATRRRLPAIPWTVPITVHFACDDDGWSAAGSVFCVTGCGLAIAVTFSAARPKPSSHVNASDVPGAAAGSLNGLPSRRSRPD